MKLVKTASGKKKLKISKREWKSIGKTAGWMKTANVDSIIERPDGKWVILTPEMENHIWKTHSPDSWGKGSIFKSMPNLQQAAVEASINPNEVFYPIQGEGWNLVLPMNEAMQLPDAQSINATKEEDINDTGKMEDMSVPAVSTSAHLSNFETNEAWVLIVPAKWEFIDGNLKTDELQQKLDEGNLFSIVSAFPGRKDVPKITEWAGNWAVIMPQK